MDYLHILRKQVTGLQSGDGPKQYANSFSTPPRMQTPSNNSKIPRFINHGFTLQKQQDLSKMSVPTKRRFDDVPRLDIPLSPDTGDEANATTESTTTSTVLSPSQSGDGSLVTVDSWKSGNWTNGGNCLCRRSQSTPFSPQELKEGVGNCSKILVVEANESNNNENMMEVDPDVDEITVRLDFKMNGRSNPSPFTAEMNEECYKDEIVDENEGEEINVSLKPISLKSTDSEVNEECSSLKGTESFTYASELSNQIHSPTSGEKISWPTFNNNSNNCSSISLDTSKLSVKYQRSDLHARIKSMIDFGKSLLSSRISEQDQRSSCTTLSSTFSSRGKCESESQLSTIKSGKKTEMADNKSSRRWNQKQKMDNWANFQDKIGTKSTPQLCLLNSAKFNSPSSSEDWYDTNEESSDGKVLNNNEEEAEVSPTSNTSETVMTTTDSDSAILLSTVGVQVDLIEWDRMGKQPSEVRDIGVQVSKRGSKKQIDDRGKGCFPAVRKPLKKRTVYFDLSTPKQIGLRPDVPNIYYDVKECESDRDSEQDLLSDSLDHMYFPIAQGVDTVVEIYSCIADFHTSTTTTTSQEFLKSPYTPSPKDTDVSKMSIFLKEEGSIHGRKMSSSDDTESCKDDATNKSTEAETVESKPQSDDTYTIDLTNQWANASKTQTLPATVTNLTAEGKTRWLKDIKARNASTNPVPLPTPSKIPSSTKLARDTAKKASTSLTQVNCKQIGPRKFQSPHPGERIKSMDEVRKVSDLKGIQRFRGMSDSQSKKM